MKGPTQWLIQIFFIERAMQEFPTATPEEFRCWKVENLRQYLTMRDLAKTGKKEELTMFFGM
jgi:hypothetical protein